MIRRSESKTTDVYSNETLVEDKSIPEDRKMRSGQVPSENKTETLPGTIKFSSRVILSAARLALALLLLVGVGVLTVDCNKNR